LLCVLAAAEALVLTDASPERIIGAAPLIFILPGAAMQLLVNRGRARFRGVEAVVAAVALSLTATIATGLALDRFGAGLTSARWAWTLGAVTLGAILLSLLLPGRADAREPAAQVEPAAARASGGWWRWAATSIAAAGAIAVGSVGVVITHTAAVQRDDAWRLTQLWALPDGSRAIRVGITNNTGAALTYRVVVTQGTRSIASSDVPVLASRSWTSVFNGAAPYTGSMTVSLFVGSVATPLRRVSVALPAPALQPGAAGA
jgi:hypothetical protein